MSDTRIILASASPRRIQLLHQIGIEAEVIPSHRPEVKTSSDPETVVRELSRQKAEDIAEQVRSGMVPLPRTASGEIGGDSTVIVIGADTVVAIDGKILGKPGTHEEAYDMIRELAGRTHHVFTGVTVWAWSRLSPSALSDSGANASLADTVNRRDGNSKGYCSIRTFTECTLVHVAQMSEQEIRDYADSEEPMDKAGAYGIQGFFGRYITGIEGDYNNVVGLPVAHLYQTLKGLRNCDGQTV